MVKHQTWKRAARVAAVAAIALVASTALADTPTTPSNFDPDSFGNNMVFLGVTATPSVFFDGSCTDPELTAPQNRCVVVGTGSAATTFAFPDLASIYIPPRSTKTIIWPTFIFVAYYQLKNDTATQADGTFLTNTIFTIESDVLKDPSVTCMDSGTGVFHSCNGQLVITYWNVYGEELSLAPGARALKRVRANSTPITAMATSTFQGTSNLSAKQIKKMFESPMTVRIGLSGRVKLVDPNWLSSVLVGLRLTGDR